MFAASAVHVVDTPQSVFNVARVGGAVVLTVTRKDDGFWHAHRLEDWDAQALAAAIAAAS